MKKIFFLGFLSVMVFIFAACKKENDNKSGTSQRLISGWEIDSTDFSYSWISPTDVEFLNQEVGYIIGSNGYLLKTINGGKSWVKSYIEKDSAGIMTTSLSFIDETTGYIYGYYNVLNGKWYGVLYKTIDGGESWQKQYYSTVYNMRSLKFFDRKNGIALNLTNSGSQILTTQNGGLSWDIESVSTDISAYRLFFLGDISFVPGKNQTILKSTDYGRTWKVINTPVSSINQLFGFYFINENNGFLDLFNKKYKTTNGGSSWTEIQLPFNFNTPSASQQTFHFSNQTDGIYFEMMTAYKGGDFPSLIGTYVYTTNDGGVTWTKSDLFSNFAFGPIIFITDSLAYCINNNYLYTLRKQ